MWCHWLQLRYINNTQTNKDGWMDGWICMRYSSWSIVHLYLFDQIFNFYYICFVYSGYSQMTSLHISLLDERWTVYSYTARQNRRTVLHSIYCLLLNQVPFCLWILISIWIFINDAMSQQIAAMLYWFDCFTLCNLIFVSVSVFSVLMLLVWKDIWPVKELLQEYTFRVFSK